MKYNPNDYETVKSRKKRFYTDYPEGRIIVESVSAEPMEYAFFKVSIYKDHAVDRPVSTGFALELRDKEMSINRNGDKYASVNYTSWTENCEESAVGRALDNAGYSGNLKCSREEMEKAERMEKMKKDPYETDKKYYLNNPHLNQKEKDKLLTMELTPELKETLDNLITGRSQI